MQSRILLSRKQTLLTLIRLLSGEPYEQSDPGPYCWQYRLKVHKPIIELETIVMNGRKGLTLYLPVFVIQLILPAQFSSINNTVIPDHL